MNGVITWNRIKVYVKKELDRRSRGKVMAYLSIIFKFVLYP